MTEQESFTGRVWKQGGSWVTPVDPKLIEDGKIIPSTKDQEGPRYKFTFDGEA